MEKIVSELQALLVSAQAALDAAQAVPAPQADAVRSAVEAVLQSEGWSAPVPAELESPAEDASAEDVAEAAAAA